MFLIPVRFGSGHLDTNWTSREHLGIRLRDQRPNDDGCWGRSAEHLVRRRVTALRVVLNCSLDWAPAKPVGTRGSHDLDYTTTQGCATCHCGNRGSRQCHRSNNCGRYASSGSDACKGGDACRAQGPRGTRQGAARYDASRNDGRGTMGQGMMRGIVQPDAAGSMTKMRGLAMKLFSPLPTQMAMARSPSSRFRRGGSWQGTMPSHHSQPPSRTPPDILKERFARGEIDKDEERRRILGE